MEVIRGSHHRGVCTSGIFADDATVASFDQHERQHLTAEPGELILLHNLLLHRSFANSQDKPRRAISLAFIEAESQFAVRTGSVCSRAVDAEGDDLSPHRFPLMFGSSRGVVAAPRL
jgi:ectoine hydroxylase-related dioxygenase (phytanoyl-CoA dioxygenase family)